MNTFYVYEHWRTDKDECFYVGKGKNNRAYNMNNRNFYHKAIQKKLSSTGFAVEIKIVASGLDENTAFEVEMGRISFWRKANADLANFSNGGEGKTGAHSASHKNNISQALKGKKKSQFVIDAVIASNKSRKGIKRKERTTSHMQNLSRSLKGRVAPNKKQVMCLDDGVIYKSAMEACAAYGIKSQSCISFVCNGKRKTAANRRFQYIEVV